jgi:hypothetical protein
MARCEVCGNEYARPMVIRVEDRMGTFDSFECALQAMARGCAQCKGKVIGLGVVSGGSIYCCASCARHAGLAAVSA